MKFWLKFFGTLQLPNIFLKKPCIYIYPIAESSPGADGVRRVLHAFLCRVALEPAQMVSRRTQNLIYIV